MFGVRLISSNKLERITGEAIVKKKKSKLRGSVIYFTFLPSVYKKTALKTAQGSELIVEFHIY